MKNPKKETAEENLKKWLEWDELEDIASVLQSADYRLYDARYGNEYGRPGDRGHSNSSPRRFYAAPYAGIYNIGKEGFQKLVSEAEVTCKSFAEKYEDTDNGFKGVKTEKQSAKKILIFKQGKFLEDGIFDKSGKQIIGPVAYVPSLQIQRGDVNNIAHRFEFCFLPSREYAEHFLDIAHQTHLLHTLYCVPGRFQYNSLSGKGVRATRTHASLIGDIIPNETHMSDDRVSAYKSGYQYRVPYGPSKQRVEDRIDADLKLIGSNEESITINGCRNEGILIAEYNSFFKKLVQFPATASAMT